MGIWNSFLYTVNLKMISSPELDVLILLWNKILLNRKIMYQKTHPSSLPRAKTVPSRFQDTSVRPNGLCCGYTSNNVKFRNSLLKSIIMNVTIPILIAVFCILFNSWRQKTFKFLQVFMNVCHWQVLSTHSVSNTWLKHICWEKLCIPSQLTGGQSCVDFLRSTFL